MEDARVAKFFIGTILNETIEEIQVKPQEFTYKGEIDYTDPEVIKAIESKLVERFSIRVYRLDFLATIKTVDGTQKKVLVEIQKTNNQVDLMRFRNYLAEQYKKQDEIETEAGKRKLPLPIVTIYLLGFSLPEIETSAIRVERQYVDLITNSVIDKKSDFIEKLTHDCFVVQLQRIKAKYQTRLDKLLSVFEQANFVDENKIIKRYNHEIDDEGVRNMTDILHHIGTDPDEKKQIEDEQEANRVFDVAVKEKTDELTLKLYKAEKEIEELKRRLEGK